MCCSKWTREQTSTVISEELFKEEHFGKLQKTSKILLGPGQDSLQVKGLCTVKLSTKSKATTQDIYVISGLKMALLGRPAIHALGIMSRIDTVNLDSLESVKRQFPELFQGLGKMQGEYEISLKPDSKPFSLSTPRRIPLPLMSKVKQELEDMENQGVITRVEQPTDWCAGMVVVPKPSGAVRICVDLTKLNNAVNRERYILPSVEHSLGQLKGAKVFSKLDANSGFWQIPLSQNSALLTTFITPFGRFCFNRLCFGISSAPEHFQKRMSQMLEGLEGVLCHMDDILVFGASQTEHDQRLVAVLKKLQKGGVTLNQKCEFSKKSVKFLGQILDESGVYADPEKVRAITHMSEPTNTSEMRRFMGMINHLGKFLPNLAEKTQPLRDLLQKKNMWAWGEPQQRAFENIKQDLSTPPGLALYDLKAPTVVSADASSYGLGAVLLQIQGDKQLKPIAYASRALTKHRTEICTNRKGGSSCHLGLWALLRLSGGSFFSHWNRPQTLGTSPGF